MPAERESAPSLAAVQARLAAINQQRPGVAGLFTAVRQLVVVASSSRGGSSIFTEILRRSPELVHLQGEITPFLNLAGLGAGASGYGSDHLPAAAAGGENRGRLAILEGELARELGVNRPVDLRDPRTLARFQADLHWRLTCQWPELAIGRNFLYTAVDLTLAELQGQHGWPPGAFPDPQLFQILLLARLRIRQPGINPWYYDLAPPLIRRHCPSARIDPAPPARLLLEEPPFVAIAPSQPATAALAAGQTLVIKTPGNVYRLPFLRALFPKARFRVLHLVRHPGQAINGLVDGWLHHGFFAHHLPGRLRIRGYSDHFSDWGKSWWKYDLPPGWEEWTERTLVEVCGFQWRSSHQATLDYLAQSGVEQLRVRFEAALGEPHERERTFTEVANWLGIDPTPLTTAALGNLPPVMATGQPRQNRWFHKAALLEPVLTEKNIRQLAGELGYDALHG
ncbi:MAG: sulfotransferase [Desulfobulbaceae bacterium]|nr:sulfotransferase [Desulfobulbaceae bacterium]